MNIACPHCQAEVAVPNEVMRRGVARVACEACSFAFVIRLGDPGSAASRPEQPAPSPPIEGLKSSGKQLAASGVIGNQRPRFIAADTRTSVMVDPALQNEIADAARVPAPASMPEQETPLTDADISEESPDEGFESFRPVKAPVQPPPGATRPRALAVPPPAPAIPSAPEPRHATGAAIAAPSPADAAPEAEPAAAAASETAATPPPASPPEPAPPAHYFPGLPPQPSAGTVYYPGPQQQPNSQGAAIAAPGSAGAYADLEVYVMPPQQPGRALRGLGLLMTTLIVLFLLFVAFVAARNNWKLDFGNIALMLERAFGTSRGSDRADELRGLDASQPNTETARLRGGELVLLATGVVKNNDTRAHRFIVVRGRLQRGGYDVAAREAPAGNVFELKTLASYTMQEVRGHLNPGGRDGRNQRLEPGQTLEYMVVIDRVPSDYDKHRYSVKAEVSQAELCDEQ